MPCHDGLSYRVRNRCGHCVACGSPCASPTQGSLALSIGSVQVHTHTLTHKRSISISKPIKRARTHSLTLVRVCAGTCVRARGSERMMLRRAKRPKLPSIAPPAKRASPACQTQSPNATCSLTDEPQPIPRSLCASGRRPVVLSRELAMRRGSVRLLVGSCVR